jgi:hypothetical protein
MRSLLDAVALFVVVLVIAFYAIPLSYVMWWLIVKRTRDI